LNRYVFNLVLEVAIFSQSLMSNGRLFHNFGTQNEKAGEPYDLRLKPFWHSERHHSDPWFLVLKDTIIHVL